MMKFVYDLEGKSPQVSATTHAFNTEVYTTPPRFWNGSRAEILIVDCIDWENDEKRREGPSLHIEGDTAALRAAFQSIIEQLDLCDGFAKEEKAALVVRSMLCPLCYRWNDPLAPWHGDGKGKRCYGLLDQRKELVQAEVPPLPDPWNPGETES